MKIIILSTLKWYCTHIVRINTRIDQTGKASSIYFICTLEKADVPLVCFQGVTRKYGRHIIVKSV